MKNHRTAALRFAVSALVLSAFGCRSGALSATPSSPAATRPSVLPSRAAIIASMTSVADWQLANPSSHMLWQWHQAPFWAGLYAFAPLSSNPQDDFDAIRLMGEANEWNHGPSRFHADARFIHSLNVMGVAFGARLSHRLLVDLLETTGPWVADLVEHLPLNERSLFAVSWAGER